MKDNEILWLGIVIFFLTTMFCGVCASISGAERDSLKHEALKRGYAIWATNPQGKPVFEWKN